jgi:hypothetical protein
MPMDKLFEQIKAAPLSYLPERSLSAFHWFLSGYTSRIAMETAESQDFRFPIREFEEWLCARFGMPRGALGAFQIVLSYSFSEEEALQTFFSLFEEFEKSASAVERSHKSVQLPKYDLVPLLREIRKQPALYIGHACFSGISGYLAGHLQAGKDLGLPMTSDEELFSRFKQWVETTKNRAKAHRHWYKIISFYSGDCDCGHVPSGAFSIFYRWLDEFASEIGIPDAFRL